MPENKGLFHDSSSKKARPLLARSCSFSKAALFSATLLLVALSGLWISGHLLLSGNGPGYTSACSATLEERGLSSSNVGTLQRRRLYQDMALHIHKDELKVLEVSGSDDKHPDTIFRFEHQKVKPILKRLSIPVRAVVLPFRDQKVTGLLETALRNRLRSVVPEELVWFQDSSLYHATVFHTSSFKFPVIEAPAELKQVQSVGSTACPMRVMLERIIVTRTGVIIACWQVAAGTEPATLRRLLREAVEDAPPPQHQVIKSPYILHTTVARLLEIPAELYSEVGHSDATSTPSNQKKKPETPHLDPIVLSHMADAMTSEMCGLEMLVDNAWLVHERDLLALALGGEFTKYNIPFLCKGHGK